MQTFIFTAFPYATIGELPMAGYLFPFFFVAVECLLFVFFVHCSIHILRIILNLWRVLNLILLNFVWFLLNLCCFHFVSFACFGMNECGKSLLHVCIHQQPSLFNNDFQKGSPVLFTVPDWAIRTILFVVPFCAIVFGSKV